MINPRFQPGGDKYESIREDDRRAFWEKVDEDREHLIDVLKSVVSTWTENEWLSGNIDDDRFIRFILHYPEWDHEELYETISEEMERVLGICELSRSSAAIQGA